MADHTGRRRLIERLRLPSAFLLGMAVGAAAIAPIAGRQVEALRLQAHQASSKLSNAEDEIVSLKSEVSQLRSKLPSQPAVRSVAVNVRGVNPVVSLDIQNQIHALIEGLVGLPVSRVDPVLFRNLVDGRIVPSSDRLYKLNLRLAIIGPEIQLFIDATEQS